MAVIATAFKKLLNVIILPLSFLTMTGIAQAQPAPVTNLTVTQTAADSFNLVIVQLGANDIRNIREGSQRFVFCSPEWFDTYGSRAQILWDELNKLSQTVIWVGLPIVGSDTLQTQYSQVTEVQQAIVLANGGIFYDIRELTMFGSEAFVMNALWDGELVQMRAPDRIHFTEAGYDAVSSVLTQHLINASREADKDAILNSVELQ